METVRPKSAVSRPASVSSRPLSSKASQNSKKSRKSTDMPKTQAQLSFVPMRNMKEKNWFAIKGVRKVDTKAATRSASALSVNPPSDAEMKMIRKEILEKHPLKSLEPLGWRNVPICVAQALEHMKVWAVQADESLFDF